MSLVDINLTNLSRGWNQKPKGKQGRGRSIEYNVGCLDLTHSLAFPRGLTSCQPQQSQNDPRSVTRSVGDSRTERLALVCWRLESSSPVQNTTEPGTSTSDRIGC